MKQVKVLVVDDSVVYRAQIKRALGALNWIEVVGVAANGKIAISRLEQIQIDLVILDLEMPEMDGIETLQEMKSKNMRCKVLVFSSASKRGAEATLKALNLGAEDFIAKPGESTFGEPSELIRSFLEPKLRGMFPDFEHSVAEPGGVKAVENKVYQKVNWSLFRPQILVIASSTGGPTLLEKIFSELRPPLDCPILIAQHMPPLFTATLAERIEKLSGIPTREGIHGEVLEKNRIYIAPGNFHMTLVGTKERACISLDQGALQNSVRPAADPLFESAAGLFKENCLGIVLTGMGADGQRGAVRIKEKNGAVIIQDQESCVVYGMPSAVKSSGAYDRILNPKELIHFIQSEIVLSQSHKTAAAGG